MNKESCKRYFGHIAIGFIIGFIGFELIATAHATSCVCTSRIVLLELDSIEALADEENIVHEESIWRGKKMGIEAWEQEHLASFYVQYSASKWDRKYILLMVED